MCWVVTLSVCLRREVRGYLSMGNKAKPITVKKELIVNGVAKPWEEATPEEKQLWREQTAKRLNDVLRPYGYTVFLADEKDKKEVS